MKATSINSFWRDLHLTSKLLMFLRRQLGSIPNSIKEAFVEAIHATHLESLIIVDMTVQACWP